MVVSILEDALAAPLLQSPDSTATDADAFQYWGHDRSSHAAASSAQNMQWGEVPLGRGGRERVSQNGEQGGQHGCGSELDDYDEAEDSDEDDIEVEEDEEEEDEELEDYEREQQPEGGLRSEGGRVFAEDLGGEGEEGRVGAREAPPQRQRVLAELLELGQEVGLRLLL